MNLGLELVGVTCTTRPGLEAVMKTAVPMGRMADRRDLKGAAIYFLSDALLYTTCSNLVISGGNHAGRL
jgi:NAD(P)-dependent dehydrogenase (short-subunit alcohol dehydrogenase family)